jgi:hypothetical protein
VVKLPELILLGLSVLPGPGLFLKKAPGHLNFFNTVAAAAPLNYLLLCLPSLYPRSPISSYICQTFWPVGNFAPTNGTLLTSALHRFLAFTVDRKLSDE